MYTFTAAVRSYMHIRRSLGYGSTSLETGCANTIGWKQCVCMLAVNYTDQHSIIKLYIILEHPGGGGRRYPLSNLHSTYVQCHVKMGQHNYVWMRQHTYILYGTAHIYVDRRAHYWMRQHIIMWIRGHGTTHVWMLGQIAHV